MRLYVRALVTLMLMESDGVTRELAKRARSSRRLGSEQEYNRCIVNLVAIL